MNAQGDPIGAGADADITARLHGVGLKATRVRLRTVAALQNAQEPQSHDALAQALQGQAQGAIDRITVYRNLMALTRAGLVRREHSGDRVYRYRLAGRKDAHKSAHPHFTCRSCGESQCLPPSSVGINLAANLLTGQSGGLEVTISGQCGGCLKRAPES